jgi:osmotically-inducible protein OsmY
VAQIIPTAHAQKDLDNISVETTTKEITLHGTVPKGRLDEAVGTAAEIGKRKINAQLIKQWFYQII